VNRVGQPEAEARAQIEGPQLKDICLKELLQESGRV
jgi:hypothetical protein